MNQRKLGYWVATGLAALIMVGSGLADVTQAAPVMAVLENLGYPGYVASLLGIWKLLGATAIVAPGLPRLKEWAYAGMFFDLSGAVISHTAAGDPIGTAIPPLVILGIVMASWALRPDDRRTHVIEKEPERGAPAQAPLTAT